MQPFQQRVIEERNELVIKFENLEKFIESDFFNSIPRDEQRRLIKQSAIMHAYISILVERIACLVMED